MAKLVDSSLWIDLTRSRSPRTLKQFIAAQLEDREVCLAEPVAFEVLRHATDAEARLLIRQFETLPLLTTPADMWSGGAELGRACRRGGVTAGSLDLLIAVVALHHDAVILTFDEDFDQIARVSPLKVHRLPRPFA